MKVLNQIKKTPFIITLIIIIIISISNQKQYTRLKILIWNTPSLALGTYLAISSGTGYIFSYIVTTNIARGNKLNVIKKIKYKSEDLDEKINLNKVEFNEVPYENTFIERDIKDPSPTVNANFRIIGRSNRINELRQKDSDIKFESNSFSDESDYQSYEQEINFINEKGGNPISNDWEDYSYTNW